MQFSTLLLPLYVVSLAEVYVLYTEREMACQAGLAQQTKTAIISVQTQTAPVGLQYMLTQARRVN